MTPVAPLVAFRATSWDAALAETLSRCADLRAVSGVASEVHSVHARVINVVINGQLIAIADEQIDDAPWTVRVAGHDWSGLRARPGDSAHVVGTSIRIDSAEGGWRIDLDDADRWLPPPAQLSDIRPAILHQSHACLSGVRPLAPETHFGRASAALLGAGINALRVAAAAFLDGDEDGHRRVAFAVGRLVGLGEGLTPSGDDLLTGLGFLAAQSGSGIASLILPLSDGVEAVAAHTTLLSLTTMRAAVQGRGRQSMHDLTRALQNDDIEAFRDAARRILAIGHTSGADILAGIRLALELALSRYAPIPPEKKRRP